MPRIGQNPSRWSKEPPTRSGLVCGATIVYAPEPSGYWANLLPVLEACLQSFRATAPDVDLHVLDNGSHPDVRAALQTMFAEGTISRLVLSRDNLGKVGAWNVLFGGCAAEYVAYFDSDVLFLQGWLENSLEVARAFPQVGIVTAQPIAGGDLRTLWTARQALQEPSVTVQHGLLIPDNYVLAQLAGLGAGTAELAARNHNRCDVLLTRGGVSAYATASHFQFLAPMAVIHQLFPAETHRALGDDLQFDDEMQRLGFWRLATTDYLVHHLGNNLPDLAEELPWLSHNQPSPMTQEAPRQHLMARLARSTRFRRLLKWLATLIHKALAAGRR